MSAPVFVLGAYTLYPAILRDVLMLLALHQLILARWTDCAVEMEDVEAGKAIALILKPGICLKLPEKERRLRLYDELHANEQLYQLLELLRGARGLEDLSALVSEKIGRKVSEEGVLLWLALGAALRKEERPMVRPVIHTFVRGMGGAVVSPGLRTFPRITSNTGVTSIFVIDRVVQNNAIYSDC